MPNQIEQIKEWQSSRKLDKMPYSHYNEMTNIAEEISEAYRLDRREAKNFVEGLALRGMPEIEEQIIDACFDMCVYAIGAMMKLGYDPVKVFDEGLKEINDRTGEYDETVGKWMKQVAKPDAYKADYSKARL